MFIGEIFVQHFHWLNVIMHEQFLDKEKLGLWSTLLPKPTPLTPGLFFVRRPWLTALLLLDLALQQHCLLIDGLIN